LEKGNVAVSPGSGFGPAGEGFLRMSLVENEARLRQAVRQIQRCLREAESQYSGAAKGGLKEVAAEQTTITPH
jgi:alanine-synthesizing transaminase